MEVEEYLHTSFRPDCDFIDGNVLERNVGLKRHSWALGQIGIWFRSCPGLCSLISLRLRVAPSRVRVADVVVVELPLPEEEVFTSPPWLCVEIMSPDDTMSSMQDRLDDYLRFVVPNLWVVDPWKHRGWNVTSDGWAVASDGVMRTADGRVAMPLADVLFP